MIGEDHDRASLEVAGKASMYVTSESCHLHGPSSLIARGCWRGECLAPPAFDVYMYHWRLGRVKVWSKQMTMAK